MDNGLGEGEKSNRKTKVKVPGEAATEPWEKHNVAKEEGVRGGAGGEGKTGAGRDQGRRGQERRQSGQVPRLENGPQNQGSMSGGMGQANEEERPEMTSSGAEPSGDRKRFGSWAELQVATGVKGRADTGDT